MVSVHCKSRSQELIIDFLTKNLKNLLVRNHWTNFNIILQKCSFGDLLPRLFKPFGFVKKHGRQGAWLIFRIYLYRKKVRKKSRECHNHKPQPFPDTKRKRKPTNPNKHKSIKRTKSTKISSLFPKRGNRNAKRTEKHKNKMTQGKKYNKSPRRINHNAPKSKTNTGKL